MQFVKLGYGCYFDKSGVTIQHVLLLATKACIKLRFEPASRFSKLFVSMCGVSF